MRTIVWLCRSPKRLDAEQASLSNSGETTDVARIVYLFRNGKSKDHLRAADSYVGSFPLCMFSRPARWLPRLFHGTSRFRYTDQRPRMLYVPHPKATPWHETDATAITLESQFPKIRDEFHHIEHDVRQHPERYLVDGGDWKVFTLFRDGKKIERNCVLCPETSQIIERLPICPNAIGLACFSVMEPGTHVKKHCGPVNTRLRYHLGLETPLGASIRVGQETRKWEEGKCLVFDDSFEHEVQHKGNSRRVVLIVDCWHSELTKPEREFVEVMLRLT